MTPTNDWQEKTPAGAEKWEAPKKKKAARFRGIPGLDPLDSWAYRFTKQTKRARRGMRHQPARRPRNRINRKRRERR